MNAKIEHGDYDLLENCGQGGMGVVYRARDRRLNRIVALKFLLTGEDAGSTSALQRFQREAEAIAALNYPGIATIYEAGKWEGSPFLALEFLAGGTLRARLPARFGLAEILDYACQLGDALAFAHSKGVLHRDIKPANCMFNDSGVLKLVDFGLAKPLGSPDLTQSGCTVGTIPYMAPELLRGGTATERSDLYALGAVVFEMAAGRPLNLSASIGTMVQQIMRGTTVPLEHLRPDLPAALCAAVNRAVAPRAEDRFESVEDFVSALRSPAILHPDADITPTATIEHSARRTSARWWLLAAGVLLLLVAVLVVLHFTSNSSSVQTLVVLPFENLSGNAADEALCVGLQETVTSALAGAQDLRGTLMIVPSSEVRRSHTNTIADARRQFHATLALTGSAHQGSNQLLVVLNLVDARNLRQKDSRILNVPAGETAELQPKLKESLGELLGAGAVLSGQTPGDSTTNSKAYDLFLRGRGALQDAKLDDAMRFLKEAVDTDPGFALARAKLAEAYLHQNISTQDPKWLALADSEVAKAATSGTGPDILMSQALIRKAMGKWQEAIGLFQAVLKSEPANVSAYRYLAETWDGAGNQEEAEKTYKEALRLRPGYWPLYDSLGNFYSLHQQYTLAEQTFSAGIALSPDSPFLYYNLGANYFRASRWAEAAAAFEKSVAIQPTGFGYSNLGTVHFYQGNYVEAAKDFEAATRLQPANPVNWGNLGDGLWQIRGQREQAKTAFAKAASLAEQQLAIKRDYPSMRKLYALYLAKLGKKDQALAEVAGTREQAPNDGNVAFYAARVYAVLGDADHAFGELRRSLKLGFSASEVGMEPDFADLKKDPRYREIGNSAR